MKKLAFLLLAFAACQEKPTENEGIGASKKVEIAPPIAALDIPFKTFEAIADKENKFELENGSVITIPVNTLVGADGKFLTGKVNIRYREMHDAADILLSGIPMNYEAKGQTRHMQTAGMFELRGEQDGKPVGIAPNAGITVRMASYEVGDDYSFFYLDENKGWEFIDYGGKPEINTKKTVVKTKTPELAFPLGKEYFCFNYMSIVDVMLADNPGSIYENRENPSFGEKAKKYGMTWLNVYGHPAVQFEGVSYPSSLMLWKRLSAKPFPDWFAKTNKYVGYDLKQVKGNLYEIVARAEESDETFTAQVQLVMPLKALFKFPPEYWENNYEEGMAKVREEQARLRLQAEAFRTFEVNGFGIYNYDKLMKEEDKIEVVADFKVKTDKTNELFDLDFVFYLPEDNKTVIKLPKNDWDKVVLLPNNAARFVAILPNAAVGLYSAKEYRSIDFDKLRMGSSVKPSYSFDLVKTIDKLESADQLRTVYN